MIGARRDTMEAYPKSDIQFGKRVFRSGVAYTAWVILATTILGTAGPLGPYFNAAGECFAQAFGGNPPPDVTDRLMIVIENASTWWLVAGLVACNQVASSIAGSTVDPWSTNELCDDTVYRIRFGYWKSLVFVTMYQVAGWLDCLIFLFISLQRPDFMLIGLLTDVICSAWTTRIHLQHKLLMGTERLNGPFLLQH